MQLEIFDTTIETAKPEIELWELFEAYYSCRSNKRNTIYAVAFEVDYESKLVQLWEEINNGTYLPGRSIAFIVDNLAKEPALFPRFWDTPCFIGHSIQFDTPRRRANTQHAYCQNAG